MVARQWKKAAAPAGPLAVPRFETRGCGWQTEAEWADDSTRRSSGPNQGIGLEQWVEGSPGPRC